MNARKKKDILAGKPIKQYNISILKAVASLPVEVFKDRDDVVNLVSGI